MKQEKQLISSEVLFPAIEELLAEGRQAAFTVTGMSMWPFLCHGRDQVIVEACKSEELRKGDIILLRTPLKNYLLHRITKLTDDGFVTTGDGNFFRDGQFPFHCFRARVVKLVHRGKVIDCRSRKWKLLSNIWMALFPVRRWMFAFWFRIRKYIRHE